MVYNRLASELPEEFYVFYSGPWLAIDRYGNEKDGECDFILAHARLGILAVEVKGGGISFDPKSGRWTSTDRYGVVHTIRDPVDQARSAKHNILAKLKSSRKWAHKQITLRHGVIFPDAETPAGDLGADMPVQIFCAGRRFTEDLIGWINERLRNVSGGSGDDAGGLGLNGIAVLKSLFASPFTLGFRISASISNDVRELDLLEPQQFLALDYISKIPRIRIEGAAGTGKTILALEAAIRAGRDGIRTLLTCYSTPLARYLQRRLSDTANVTVLDFYNLCLSSAKAAGLMVDHGRDDNAYLEYQLPELLVNALDLDGQQRFDCIVVDEGQDFRDSWWFAVDEALNQGGSIRVFLDPNQRLYDSHTEFLDSLELVPIPLNRNLRNTRKIHQASMAHYSGPVTEAIGPVGVELTWVESESGRDMAKVALRELQGMVDRDEVNPTDIAVLVPDHDSRNEFLAVAADARSRLDFTDAESISDGAVVIDTVKRYKGLEKPVVILCIAGPETGLTELAYVGMTRARAALSIVCQLKDRHWIESGWAI